MTLVAWSILLFKFAEFDLIKFEGYLNYMHSTPSWNWAFEKSVGPNNINYKECSFEYFMKEDTYLKAKEEIWLIQAKRKEI